MDIFVIGIGGTGMRCIEAFTHLCAIGMFDKTDVHLLALDTDKENGNFTRLKNLKDAYLKTKSLDEKKRTTLENTFFSANLHYYEFSPDYSRKSTFEGLYNYKFSEPEEKAIADLLFTNDAKAFDLKHGYRAQTHLGSMLMYHSIINDIKTNNKSDLRRFIQKLITTSTSSSKPRVFIMGSVFGGTGASSIPIIPKAIGDAAKIISNATGIGSNTYFGATLLTSYFSFPLPNENERRDQRIIASSDKFALNSQAAMMFYEADKTVKKTYQKFYMMGTDDMKPVCANGKEVKDQTVTGGETQENDSHYIELLAAFAAYHFFNSPETGVYDGQLKGLAVLKANEEVEYLYRPFDDEGKMDFIDFVSTDKKDELAKKLGMFTAMSFLVNLKYYNFFEAAQSGDLRTVHIEGYENIDKYEIDALKSYMSLYHFGINGVVKDGWLRQVHRSTGGGDNFLLNSSLFGCKTENELKKFGFNNALYKKDSGFETYRFKVGITSNIISTFKNHFIKTEEATSITNMNEKLIKRVYDTLCKLYNFNS